MLIERFPTSSAPFLTHGPHDLPHAATAVEQTSHQGHARHLGKRRGLLGVYNLLHQPQVGATVSVIV